MDCPNCSAPMCIQSGSAYLRCDFCGTLRQATESPPSAAAAEAEHHRTGTLCPCCQGQLDEAMIADTVVSYCLDCRGFLIEEKRLAELVKRFRGKRTALASEPVPLELSMTRRSLSCPLCQRTMKCRPYDGPGNVMIDSCRPCRQAWLDAGEMTAIGTAAIVESEAKQSDRRKKKHRPDRRRSQNHGKRDRLKASDSNGWKWKSWFDFFDDLELDEFFDFFDD